MGELVIALPKGRLMESVVDILKEAGFISRDLNIEEMSRKLVFKDEETGNSFYWLNPGMCRFM